MENKGKLKIPLLVTFNKGENRLHRKTGRKKIRDVETTTKKRVATRNSSTKRSSPKRQEGRKEEKGKK